MIRIKMISQDTQDLVFRRVNDQASFFGLILIRLIPFTCWILVRLAIGLSYIIALFDYTSTLRQSPLPTVGERYSFGSEITYLFASDGGA